MQNIPLVRARYVYAYGAVLDQLGASKRRLLERAGLSERVYEDPEAIIPAHQAWGFIGSVADMEGIDDLGLVAGEVPIQEYGEFSKRLLQAPNLNQALESFCQLACCEYSRSDFYVSRSEHSTCFCRGPIDGSEVEKKHVELLVLTMMIATVRLAAGQDWQPRVVHLQTKDSSRVEQHHLFSRSMIHFGNEVTSFEVPQHLLAERLPELAPPADSIEYDPLEHEIPQALHLIVSELFVEGTPKIESVAEAVGASVRTLQRRLSEMNTTYSTVIETARMESAKRLLAHSDFTLKEIAHQLGYSDQPHFTRAFHRWTGISPRAYRQTR